MSSESRSPGCLVVDLGDGPRVTTDDPEVLTLTSGSEHEDAVIVGPRRSSATRGSSVGVPNSMAVPGIAGSGSASAVPAPTSSRTVILPVLPVIPTIATTNIVQPAAAAQTEASPKTVAALTTTTTAKRRILPKAKSDEVASNSEPAAPSTSTSTQSVPLSARLREKLIRKREKEAAEQQKGEGEKDEDESAEDPISILKHSPTKKKKQKRSHPSGNSSDGSGGMFSSPSHLAPSLLEEILNEKKMELMRSPQVIEVLKALQEQQRVTRAVEEVKIEEERGKAKAAEEERAKRTAKVKEMEEKLQVKEEKDWAWGQHSAMGEQTNSFSLSVDVTPSKKETD